MSEIEDKQHSESSFPTVSLPDYILKLYQEAQEYCEKARK
jgi:hypothetical protein